ncbi:hypothetical protein AA313_de0207457 [Arthrobotrys entomopaga]|nr:hypothetical protein AA313_de0207457 [Arthrobotrys entomopaga]
MTSKVNYIRHSTPAWEIRNQFGIPKTDPPSTQYDKEWDALGDSVRECLSKYTSPIIEKDPDVQEKWTNEPRKYAVWFLHRYIKNKDATAAQRYQRSARLNAAEGNASERILPSRSSGEVGRVNRTEGDAEETEPLIQGQITGKADGESFPEKKKKDFWTVILDEQRENT